MPTTAPVFEESAGSPLLPSIIALSGTYSPAAIEEARFRRSERVDLDPRSQPCGWVPLSSVRPYDEIERLVLHDAGIETKRDGCVEIGIRQNDGNVGNERRRLPEKSCAFAFADRLEHALRSIAPGEDLRIAGS
jgi:hypothetical protein